MSSNTIRPSDTGSILNAFRPLLEEAMGGVVRVRITPRRGPAFPQPPKHGGYKMRTMRVVAQYFVAAPHEGIALAWESVTGEHLGSGQVARRIKVSILHELTLMAAAAKDAP